MPFVLFPFVDAFPMPIINRKCETMKQGHWISLEMTTNTILYICYAVYVCIEVHAIYRILNRSRIRMDRQFKALTSQWYVWVYLSTSTSTSFVYMGWWRTVHPSVCRINGVRLQLKAFRIQRLLYMKHQNDHLQFTVNPHTSSFIAYPIFELKHFRILNTLVSHSWCDFKIWTIAVCSIRARDRDTFYSCNVCQCAVDVLKWCVSHFAGVAHFIFNAKICPLNKQQWMHSGKSCAIKTSSFSQSPLCSQRARTPTHSPTYTRTATHAHNLITALIWFYKWPIHCCVTHF